MTAHMVCWFVGMQPDPSLAFVCASVFICHAIFVDFLCAFNALALRITMASKHDNHLNDEKCVQIVIAVS